MTDRATLIRGLQLVVLDLDKRGYPYAGIVRQAARRIAELEALLAVAGLSGPGCKTCGGMIVQPKRGRRRVHCEDCRASRAKVAPNGSIAS